MIECPVCAHPNDDYAIKCSSCTSYIQERVPNLDFFSVLWLIVEDPHKAVRKIIIAEHKNYVFMLSLFLGIQLVFCWLWANKSGSNFDNILPLIILCIVLGLVLGVPLLLASTIFIHITGKFVGGKGSFKNTLAICGWSLAPIMFSVVFLIPLELATLGLIFFSENPSPFEVKPEVYSVLVGLQGITLLWSLLLASFGVSKSHKIHVLVSTVVVSVSVSVIVVGSYKIFQLFNI